MINDILKKINKAHEVESSKVELSKHDVELALADDIKKAIDATLAFKDQRKAAWNKASTPLIALSDLIRAELGTAQIAMRGIEDLKQKTAALGVEMPPKMIQNEQTIDTLIKERKAKWTQMDKILQQLPKLAL